MFVFKMRFGLGCCAVNQSHFVFKLIVADSLDRVLSVLVPDFVWNELMIFKVGTRQQHIHNIITE